MATFRSLTDRKVSHNAERNTKILGETLLNIDGGKTDHVLSQILWGGPCGSRLSISLPRACDMSGVAYHRLTRFRLSFKSAPSLVSRPFKIRLLDLRPRCY